MRRTTMGNQFPQPAGSERVSRQADFDGVLWVVEVQHRPRKEPYRRGIGQSLQVVGDLFKAGVLAERKVGILAACPRNLVGGLERYDGGSPVVRSHR